MGQCYYLVSLTFRANGVARGLGALGRNNCSSQCVVAEDRTRLTCVTNENSHHYTTTMWLFSFQLVPCVALGMGHNNCSTQCAVAGDRTRVRRMTGGYTHNYTTMTSRYWVQGPMLLSNLPLVLSVQISVRIGSLGRSLCM